MKEKIFWLAVNAKYSHTSLAVRYLREVVSGSAIMELTINHQLLAMLGEIYAAKPKVLGISCYIWNIEMVKALLKLLPAALPDTVIICGGPEVSYGVAEFMQAYPMVDYVCRGEGEEALPRLVEQLRQADFDRAAVNKCLDEAGIPGIAWRSQSGQISEGQDVTVADFAGKVPFAYRAEEMAEIKERILYYETSRGCPFSCAYCLSCATAGVRYLPLERVFRELAFFVAHDVRQVKFVDRTFNAKKDHFLPILQYLLALPADCRTNFHFEVAIDYLDEEVMMVLAQMPKGRVQLEIGIQSTNEKTLKAVSRVNHWQDIASHIRKIMSFHNMHLHVDLIIGLPGEDMASFHQSFNDVYALQTDMLQLGFLKFLKGAAMMNLIEPYRYRYMPMAPYEVLQSDALSYGEIRWFHSFEQVFELYYNAGRCRQTVNYLIREGEQGDAFAFWQKFTDWWEASGFHKVGHSTKNLYGYLGDFSLMTYDLSADLVDNLLRYDALMSDGGRIRPENLAWNRLQYQEITADFWKGAPSRVRAYLPAYTFTNWRDVNKKYHIEVFAYAVDTAVQEKLIRKRRALLFDYTQAEPESQSIDLWMEEK
ncbi:MAG: B12-binding domain-containing radical SAM protein [Selenomonas sp.]|uniref:B12-binding domain-containing radical SAM protein n=1 Tax=Selenomonas sp. TaxID=2053611 RepID=UPI0025ED11E5|nr:B12-binding domain-containing radical SAM protein [Selenomonas sp.]MCR5757609.1 B12-binding domain-containing radical SAM protein [Selenomonas sp.]